MTISLVHDRVFFLVDFSVRWRFAFSDHRGELTPGVDLSATVASEADHDPEREHDENQNDPAGSLARLLRRHRRSGWLAWFRICLYETG